MVGKALLYEWWWRFASGREPINAVREAQSRP